AASSTTGSRCGAPSVPSCTITASPSRLRTVSKAASICERLRTSTSTESSLNPRAASSSIFQACAMAGLPMFMRPATRRVDPARLEILDQERDAGHVAAGALERGDEAGVHRIVHPERDDRDVADDVPGTERSLGPARDEDIHACALELLGQAAVAAGSTVGGAVFDREVAAFAVAGPAQALAQLLDIGGIDRRRQRI